jgi:hypothetical protein
MNILRAICAFIYLCDKNPEPVKLSQIVKRDQKLTVHMIHHTHDDVGWLWSVDGYYNGQDGAPSVRKILTTTINELI